MRMDLYVWEGDGCMSSCDPDCLIALAYIQATHAPVQVNTCTNPRTSPSGVLPYLEVSDKELVVTKCLKDVSGIIRYLRENGYDLDEHFTRRQCARATALNSYIQTHISPFVIYNIYGENAQYEARRSWFAARLPFPLGFTVPNITRSFYCRRHIDHVDADTRRPNPDTRVNLTDLSFMNKRPDSTDFAALGTTTAHMKERKDHASAQDITENERHQARASACLADLAKLYDVSGGPYLYGDKLCSVDVVLYGHAMFMSSWDSTGGLEKHADKYPNAHTMRDLIRKTTCVSKLMDEVNTSILHSDSTVFRSIASIDREYETRRESTFKAKRNASLDELHELENTVPLYAYDTRRNSEGSDDGYDREEPEEYHEESWRKYISFGVAGMAMLLYAISTITVAVEEPDNEDDHDWEI